MAHRTRGAVPARRSHIATSVLLAVLAGLAWSGGATADIVNRAEAVATYGGDTVRSAPAGQRVPVSPAAPAIAVTMSGQLDRGDHLPRAGDGVTWTVTVANDGNVTLTSIGLVAATGEPACGPRATASIDALAPGATTRCIVRQRLGQADLDSDRGAIDNTVTVTSPRTPARTATASVVISFRPATALHKSLVAWRQRFVGVYELEYLLRAENTGTARLTGIRLADDLGAAFGRAPIVAGPWLTIDGFSGDGTTNPAYDGVSDTGLLAGEVTLAPGSSGEVTVTVRVAPGPGPFAATNRAAATVAEIDAPVQSDAPAGDPRLDGATVFEVADADGDGVIDAFESASADRDGDGIPDAFDYDPTGYFYCETNGRIVAGGQIAVENLRTGGRQTGTGSSHGIAVLRDGSDGRYQFHVTETGRYRLHYRLPRAGTASVERQPGPPLNLAAFAGDSPAVLGSGEAAATGRLADHASAANPFHLEFVVEPGAPAVLNNNIPLRLCGSPALTAQARILAGPALQGDGRSRLTYRIEVASSGDERVDEVQVNDNLASTFDDRFEVASVALVAAPPGFRAVINPFFDGRANTALLTSGGTLEPGQGIAVELTVLVASPGGTHSNRVTASGLSPLDAGPISAAGAEATAVFDPPSAGRALSATMTGEPALAAPGGRVELAATFANGAASAVSGIEFVAQLPPDLVYLPGSAAIDGRSVEPRMHSGELVWTDMTVPRQAAVTLRFDLALGADTGEEATAYAFARERQGGAAIVSDIARSTVVRDPEAAFDCAEVRGQVFDDRNRDGYVQQGEPGIAGVVIAGAGRLRVVSDIDGRFVIACPMLPAGRIGSRLELRVDAATLPQGYHLTTPPTLAVDLVRGQIARPAFGASSQRVVTHILEPTAFEHDSTRLQPESLRALANLLSLLEEELSVLRLTYLARGDPLAERRLAAARNLVAQAWSAKQRPYPLSVETVIVR